MTENKIEPFEFSFEFINDFLIINGYIYDKSSEIKTLINFSIRHRDLYTMAFDYNKDVISLTVSKMESNPFGFYCSEDAYFAFITAFAKYTNNKF